MFKQIDHVVVATKSLEESIKLYEEKFELKSSPIYVNQKRGAREARLDLGNVALVLSQPVADQGPVADYITKRGEGLYILALVVEDMAQAVNTLRQRGTSVNVTVTDGESQAFVEPTSVHGAYIQLVQGSKS
jgi:methylmalonyl-CoA/ethylmalonyl-CoA epimerase